MLEKAVRPNRKDWSLYSMMHYRHIERLSKLLLGCLHVGQHMGKLTTYQVELERRAQWAIKKFNFDMQQASFERRLQIVELEEIHNYSPKNSKNYKQWIKVSYEKYVMIKSFIIGQRVLLFNSRLYHFPCKITFSMDWSIYC